MFLDLKKSPFVYLLRNIHGIIRNIHCLQYTLQFVITMYEPYIILCNLTISTMYESSAVFVHTCTCGCVQHLFLSYSIIFIWNDIRDDSFHLLSLGLFFDFLSLIYARNFFINVRKKINSFRQTSRNCTLCFYSRIDLTEIIIHCPKIFDNFGHLSESDFRLKSRRLINTASNGSNNLINVTVFRNFRKFGN